MTTAVRRRHPLVLALILVAALGALGAIALAVMRTRETPYVEFHSPDRRYSIVVKRRASLFGKMPGQAGDAPGRVLLIDSKGQVLREAPIEMVQLIEVGAWTARSVELRPLGEWPLPE